MGGASEVTPLPRMMNTAKQNVRARVCGPCARVLACIFTKKYLVVTFYLMSLSSKFRKDPSFP